MSTSLLKAATFVRQPSFAQFCVQLSKAESGVISRTLRWSPTEFKIMEWYVELRTEVSIALSENALVVEFQLSSSIR